MRAFAAHTEDELPSWGGHQVDVVDALRRGQRGQGGRRAGAGGHSVEPSPRRGPAGCRGGAVARGADCGLGHGTT